jgi:hypothetical protein
MPIRLMKIVQQTTLLLPVALITLLDSLYGLEPDPTETFGVNLGAIAPWGERGTLIVSLDSRLRMSSNSFFPSMIERIEERLRGSAAVAPLKPISSP